MPPLECVEKEVQEGIGIKVGTQKKLLTRLPVILPQIEAGNNS